LKVLKVNGESNQKRKGLRSTVVTVSWDRRNQVEKIGAGERKKNKNLGRNLNGCDIVLAGNRTEGERAAVNFGERKIGSGIRWGV